MTRIALTAEIFNSKCASPDMTKGNHPIAKTKKSNLFQALLIYLAQLSANNLTMNSNVNIMLKKISKEFNVVFNREDKSLSRGSVNIKTTAFAKIKNTTVRSQRGCKYSFIEARRRNVVFDIPHDFSAGSLFLTLLRFSFN